jgi:hypothetical protein
VWKDLYHVCAQTGVSLPGERLSFRGGEEAGLSVPVIWSSKARFISRTLHVACCACCATIWKMVGERSKTVTAMMAIWEEEKHQLEQGLVERIAVACT